MTQRQLAWYQAMEAEGELRQVRTWEEVERVSALENVKVCRARLQLKSTTQPPSRAH